MSAILYNNSGASLYVYKRCCPDSGTVEWTASSAVSNGGTVHTSGGSDSGVGLSTTSLTVGEITDNTQFDEGCWVNPSGNQGSPSQAYDGKWHLKSATSTGDCNAPSAPCDAQLTTGGSWNNPAPVTQCTEIQSNTTKNSKLDVTSDYIFDYYASTRYEWDNIEGSTCAEQMPYRILLGGVQSIRGQTADAGRFYKISEAETRHHSLGKATSKGTD